MNTPPDVCPPGVDVDESGLDVDGPRPDGETLSEDLNHVWLDVDTGSSHVQAARGHADDARVVVDADSLSVAEHVLKPCAVTCAQDREHVLSCPSCWNYGHASSLALCNSFSAILLKLGVATPFHSIATMNITAWQDTTLDHD